MFQGSPLASNSYSNGSSTEIAKPTARAGIFPTTFNHDQQPIISNRDGEPYNRLSVQALFKAQLAKPILSYHIGDPDWIPTSAANLRRHPDSSKYHVARDPKTVPFSLAIRMIPVFTTGPLEESIYQAWALPHLIDALRDPEIQLFNNHLSYYYNEKESHPEFPFIDQMGPDSPFSANGYNEQEPKHIQQTSPDALTSSTRTDFTYPPIEDLTKTLLKYAKNANLRKLAYPTDLQARRRHFNTFIDNLRIVCNISPWTRQVFDLWPKQVSYSHPFVGTALYNLIFTNVCDPCQKHIIDGPPDARTAILTLRRHCAPLTPDHVERTREAFCSIKQPHHEVATSYLNRIRILTRDCYHAGIPNTDAELIKRTVRGGSNHSFYAASYQRFDADIRRAELNDEALPPFAELESHLLNIDESRGLTLPSQNQRNYNQHAHSTRQQSHHFQSRHPQTTHRVFTQRQQQAFSSILRPYSNPNGNNQNRSHPPRPPQNHSRPFRPPTNPSRPPFNNPNQRRPPPPSPRPSNQPQRNNRPPFRPTLNPNQRPSPNGSNINQSRNSASNAATIVCNNCGRLGHYSRNCTNPDPTKTIAHPTRNVQPTMKTLLLAINNAYFVTDSTYLFIVTTPGKLTGWIGLPTESTTSILIALKQWLTDTELLGRTQSVRFIRTDAGSAFTSTKFISECTSLGIKVEAAAPEHQEMNGICEAKWREVHNTANILLNNARLGGAFFHHAHAYAVQILNVCPAKNVIDQDGNPTTPYQYSFQRKPSIANFRVFGCPTFFKRYEPTFRNKHHI
ncbi:NB-ARC domain [Fragilaria crotonensis]|nr:NB-ARC domain [Fragilaria crotonensis]